MLTERATNLSEIIEMSSSEKGNNKLKVLILSYEVWRDDNSGGNVLSNLFSNMYAEFAQVYCSPGLPANSICKEYYQMTDFMMIRNIFKRDKIGHRFSYDSTSIVQSQINEQRSFYSFFKKFHWTIFDLVREAIWKLAKWNNDDLNKFIADFNPDIIFAPCYANLYMLRLSRSISKSSGKKIVSYISDDHFTFRHWNFSPLFWFNRILLRQALKETFPYYSVVYTMTEEQRDELTPALNANMKILRKGAVFAEKNEKKGVNDPIRLVFAGGVYCGRWKTLVHIGKILKEINKDGVKMRLDIYTPTNCSLGQLELLNDGRQIFLHSSVSQGELRKIYEKSDIALHVESFDKSYRLLTRLSFSTKIVDCLGSGCAVMAISWKEHSGLKYLQKENAAFCIDNLEGINTMLLDIVKEPLLIAEYAKKAYECGKRNHQIRIIQDNLYNDFKELVSNT